MGCGTCLSVEAEEQGFQRQSQEGPALGGQVLGESMTNPFEDPIKYLRGHPHKVNKIMTLGLLSLLLRAPSIP